MLNFFRTYQKYFFVFVTTMIVISFSFFGVINSITGPKMPDPVAFTDVNGKGVKRSELERLTYFIGTDEYDKMAFGGVWGPNFLNDGVIPKDFLATGLIYPVVETYADFLRPDFATRMAKESQYKLYHHPEAKFISVENAWSYLAPDMKRHFDHLQSGSDPLAQDVMKSRALLFLGQRQLPPLALKQVMKYQRQQYNWIPEDYQLDRVDLSLFGYQTVEDWFGPRFTRLAAALILDIAIIAEQKGIIVSDDEALASLIQQSHRSYEQNKNSPYINVVNADQYLQEQLRRLRMDLHQAVTTWKKVLLFRRYFQEYGDTMLVDRLPYQSFAQYAHEYVAGDLYQLPEAVRLSSFRDLQQYEYYIRSVAKRGKGPLSIPTEYLDAEKVAAEHPSFVQRRYRLHVASLDAQQIKNQVGTKEMWDWQLQDENWAQLEESFPIIGTADVADRDARFATLDEMTPIMRDKVDDYSRSKMVKEHPEWVQEILDEAVAESNMVGLRVGGSDAPFSGIAQSDQLMGLFDSALKGDATAQQALTQYSEDGRHYYRFTVHEAAPDLEVLTFAELKKDGSLDQALRTDLEAHYEKIRVKDAKKYQAANGEWKPFYDVRDLVAKDYFSDVLLAVEEKVESDDPLTVDDAARYRFSEWVKQVKREVEKNPSDSKWVRGDDLDIYDQDFSPRPQLHEQWKLVKSSYKLSLAGERDERIDRDKVFALNEGEWSEVYVPVQGDITFFHLREKGTDSDSSSMVQAMASAQYYLSRDAERALMRKTLKEIQGKQPIELDIFHQETEG